MEKELIKLLEKEKYTLKKLEKKLNIDKKEIKNLIKNIKGVKIEKVGDKKLFFIEKEPVKKVNNFNIKKYSLIFLGILMFIYIILLNNINYFYDWDSLSLSILLDSQDFNLFGHFESYHMIIPLLVFLINLLSQNSLFSFKIIILISNIVSLLILYLILYKLTKNKFYSVIGMLSLLSFGYLFLSLSYEDNIINLAFMFLFILFFLNSIKVINLFNKYNNLVTGVFLGLSLATHLNSILLYLFVFVGVFWIQGLNKKSFIIITKIISASLIIILPIILINCFYFNWSNINDFFNYFRVSYYNDPNLWFFSKENPSLLGQAKLINYGLTSLFFERFQFLLVNSPVFLIISPFLYCFIFIIIGLDVIKYFNNKIIKLMFLFLIIFIPHSLFYESQTSERWIFLMIPLSIILSYSLISKNKIMKYLNLSVLILIPLSGFLGLYLLTNFSPNVYMLVIDGAKEFINDSSMIILNIRSDSEFGLYASYTLGSENVLFSYDNSLTEIPNTNRTVYITNLDNLFSYDTTFIKKLTEDFSLFKLN